MQGVFVQQKKYKLIDLCEQNGYVLVEESQEMSSNSSSTGGGMRLGDTPIILGSSRTRTKTQVTSRVLTFKKK
ncbi:hypothetical protein FACS1894166_03550 [Bacilli bacterium]|nr:hypothetical protein FACS1894166_03550 [Bacilli bacterium]